MSGNFGFGLQHAVRVTPALPAVVDVDVDVAGIAHAARDHRVGDLAHGAVVDVGAELVPAVPAHRRRLRVGVGRHVVQHRQVDRRQRRVVDRRRSERWCGRAAPGDERLREEGRRSAGAARPGGSPGPGAPVPAPGAAIPVGGGGSAGVMRSVSPSIVPFTTCREIDPNISVSTTSSNALPEICPSTIGASPNGNAWVPVILPSVTFNTQTNSIFPIGESAVATHVPEMSGDWARPTANAAITSAAAKAALIGPPGARYVTRSRRAARWRSRPPAS